MKCRLCGKDIKHGYLIYGMDFCKRKCSDLARHIISHDVTLREKAIEVNSINNKITQSNKKIERLQNDIIIYFDNIIYREILSTKNTTK